MVEQCLVAIRAVEEDEPNKYTVSVSVLEGQKLEFSIEGEQDAKALFAALEAKYLEALRLMQEKVVAEHDSSSNAKCENTEK